jgi:hypothetical protein
VTKRVPVLLLVSGTFGTGKKGFLENTRVTRLVEGGDADLLVGVFFDDTEGIWVLKEVMRVRGTTR